MGEREKWTHVYMADKLHCLKAFFFFVFYNSFQMNLCVWFGGATTDAAGEEGRKE